MPFLLRCWMGFLACLSVFWGFGVLLIMLMFLVSKGPIRLNDQDLTSSEFLRNTWPSQVVDILWAVATGVIAWGLRSGRGWTREATLGLLGIAIVAAIGAGFTPSSIAGFAVVGTIGAWYLYGKRSVRAYYRALKAQDVDRGDDSSVASPIQAS